MTLGYRIEADSANPRCPVHARRIRRKENLGTQYLRDQADTLTLIVRALEAEQYVLSRATSGAEALRMIAERIPDLVVLDYKMIGMDGLAVMQTLRACLARTRPHVTG